MRKNLLALILMSVFVTPAIADKPEWAGKGKPTAEQKEAHKTAMEAKEDLDDDENLEKKKAKKAEQEQKELDKGSDKGKESREANSKKWWKFWGE